MIWVLGARVTFRLPRKLASRAEVRLGSVCSGSGARSSDEDEGAAFPAELGPTVETQFLYYLQGKKIALQNLHFGFEFGRS